jgi:hydrogenase maturation protein HypF
MLNPATRHVLIELSLQRLKRRAVLVRGVVQGVGFRPFVYRLALETHLAGSIGNNTDGVTIEIEGAGEEIDEFLQRLRTDAPPMARIDSIAVRAMEPTGESESSPARSWGM